MCILIKGVLRRHISILIFKSILRLVEFHRERGLSLIQKIMPTFHFALELCRVFNVKV